MNDESGHENPERGARMNGNGNNRPWWFMAMQTFGVPTALLLIFGMAVWKGLDKWMTPQVNANTTAVLSTVKTNEQIVANLTGLVDAVDDVRSSILISRSVTDQLLKAHQQSHEGQKRIESRIDQILVELTKHWQE